MIYWKILLKDLQAVKDAIAEDPKKAEELLGDIIIDVSFMEEDPGRLKTVRIISRKLSQAKRAIATLQDYHMLDKYIDALEKVFEEKPVSRGGGERRLMEDIRSLISKYEEGEAFGTFVKPPALMLEAALDQFFELWKPEGEEKSS